jgi:hypothetical protein
VAGISHPQSPIHTRIAAAQSTDWNKVDAALGKTATVSGEVSARTGFVAASRLRAG